MALLELALDESVVSDFEWDQEFDEDVLKLLRQGAILAKVMQMCPEAWKGTLRMLYRQVDQADELEYPTQMNVGFKADPWPASEVNALFDRLRNLELAEMVRPGDVAA